MVIDALFEFVFSQQISILFKIDYKITPVSLKHFVDHYMKILPTLEDKKHDTEASPSFNCFKKDPMPEVFEKNLNGIKKREQIELLNSINTEIKE